MKSFLTGRSQISNTSLERVVTGGVSKSNLSAGKPGGHEHSGATVETVKQGDKVVRLIVTCTCGEKIEIDCLYPAGG